MKRTLFCDKNITDYNTVLINDITAHRELSTNLIYTDKPIIYDDQFKTDIFGGTPKDYNDVITLRGILKSGHDIAIHIKNYHRSYLIKATNKKNEKENLIKTFSNIKKSEIKITEVYMKDGSKFNMFLDELFYKIEYINTTSSGIFNYVKKILVNKGYTFYDLFTDPVLEFCNRTNITGRTTIKMKNQKWLNVSSYCTYSHFECCINVNNIEIIPEEPKEFKKKTIYISWDIEASPQKKDLIRFPDPKIDPCIGVGVGLFVGNITTPILKVYYSNIYIPNFSNTKEKGQIISGLSKSTEINEKTLLAGEYNMFRKFIELIRKIRPEYLISFNGDSFDMKYIKIRMDLLMSGKYPTLSVFKSLNFSIKKTYTENNKSSSALGILEKNTFKTPGIINVDVMHCIKKELKKYPSYRLNYFLGEDFGASKVDLKTGELMKKYQYNEDTQIIAFYCIGDVIYLPRLAEKHGVFGLEKTTSQVSIYTPYYFHQRLTTVKIVGLVLKNFREHIFAFPYRKHISNEDKINNKFEKYIKQENNKYEVFNDIRRKYKNKIDSKKRNLLKGYINKCAEKNESPKLSKFTTLINSESSYTNGVSTYIKDHFQECFNGDEPKKYIIENVEPNILAKYKNDVSKSVIESIKSIEDACRYTGAHVYPIISGIHKYTLVLDYGHMYPAIIIDKNLSHELLIYDEETLIKATNAGFTTEKYEYFYRYGKKKVIWCVTGRNVRIGKTEKWEKISGILSIICKSFLDERKKEQKLMKEAKRNNDLIKMEFHDYRQMTWKVITNSVYGGCGYDKSIYYSEAIAGITTYKGQGYTKLAGKIATELVGKYSSMMNPHGNFVGYYPIIGGDTDSIFVKFPSDAFNNTKENYIKNITKKPELYSKGPEWTNKDIILFLMKDFGIILANKINKVCGIELQIEVEKCLTPLIYLTKKRYVGILYGYKSDGSIDFNGIRKDSGNAEKRGDRCILTRYICGMVSRKLLEGLPPKEIYKYAINTLKDVMNEKYDLSNFIIYKTFKGYEAYNFNHHSCPHHALACRLLRNKPNQPDANDRVGYFYKYAEPKLTNDGNMASTQVKYSSLATHEMYLKSFADLCLWKYVIYEMGKPLIEYLKNIVPEETITKKIQKIALKYGRHNNNVIPNTEKIKIDMKEIKNFQF